MLGWNWRYQDELMVLSHIYIVDMEVVIGVAVHVRT